VAFDYKSFNIQTGQLATGLFALLPAVGSANGLKAAAAAGAAVTRENATETYTARKFKSQGRLAEQRGNNYQRLSAKLDSTVRAVTRSRDKLVDLKQILSDMRKQIVLAQSGTIDDAQRAQHANTFDQLLGKLNSKVRANGGVADNLIGSSIRDIFTPGSITYKTKPDSPVDQTVNGVFSGSDYYITDGDGNVFFADLYGSLLQQFPFDDEVDGEVIGSTDTVNYDSDTGAISITHNGDSDPFITGTLTRKGLGVLHTYLYGDFKDADLRDEALTDLDAASAKLRFNIAVIEGELTKVTAQRDFNTKLVNGHKALASKAESREVVEKTTQSLEAQRQNLLYASVFQSTATFDGSGSLLSLGLSSLFDFSV
jgi:hypothetical protein